MANYQLLKADIDEKVYQNGAQEITGANLNSVLNAMVTTLGAEYQFAGVATKDTNPGTPDAKVFYIANGKGTYTNFGSLEVTEDEVVVLYWDSSWHKVSTGIASQAKLSELEKKIGADNVALEVDYVAGGAYDSSGNLSISSGKYTNEIDINNIDSIKFNGVIGSSARYCLFYTGSVLAYALSEANIVDGSVVDTSKYDKMKLSFSVNAEVRITAKYKDLPQEVNNIKKSVSEIDSQISEIDSQISTLEKETDTRLVELEKKIGADNVALEVDYVAGGAYDSSGNLSISSGKYTNEIDINNIDSIKFNGVIGSSARYCLFYTGSVLAYALSEANIVDGSVVDTSKYDKMKLSFSVNAEVRITAKYKDLPQEVDNIKKSVSEIDSQISTLEKETDTRLVELEKKIGAVDAVKTIDLFMFMGQSNMAGRGITTQEHPEKYPNIISGAGYEFKAISDPSKLYPCAEPFGILENVSGAINDYTQKTGSMVTSFVNAYFAKTRIPIVGVSASEGGTRITQWQPNGARLNDAISRLMSAIQWLTDNGYTIRHKYMAWCQGESDGDNAMSGDDYVSAFLQMFNAMKSAGIEKCFLVRIGKYNGTASRDYTMISNAQTQLCKTNEDVILVSTAFASFKEKGLMKDDWHYVQEAYNKVGSNAGSNAAEFVIGRKEPIMYDSMTNDLYFSEYSY